MHSLVVHNKPISSVVFSPDGACLGVGCAGGLVKVIDVATQKETFTARVDGMFPNQIDVRFDGTGARVFATNQYVYALQLDTQSRQRFGSQTIAYNRLAYSLRHGEVWASGDARIARVRADTLETLDVPSLPVPGGTGMITWPGVAISTHGNYVALSRRLWSHPNREDVHVCDIVTLAVAFSTGWKGHEAKHLTFHPDGTLLAAACGPVLRVWNLTAQSEIAAIKLGQLHFMGAAFSPCGRYLAAVSNDSTTRFWRVNIWDEPKTYNWDIGKLLALAFSPDGMTAAVASDKGKVLLFDVD